MRKRHETEQMLLSVFALGLVFSFASLWVPTKILKREKIVPVGSSAFVHPPNLVHYQIDPGRSRFVVRAFVGGLLSSFGHNHTIAIRDFSGEVQFTPDSPEASSLQMRIGADSLAVIDEVSDNDRRDIEQRMRADVLETGKYPEIVFHSASVTANRTADGQYQLKVSGDLTLHGVTHRVLIPARLSLGGNDLHARGEFSLRQSDYKITPPSVAAGTIKVKDELKFSFDIVARR